jgi:hypothetical protein
MVQDLKSDSANYANIERCGVKSKIFLHELCLPQSANHKSGSYQESQVHQSRQYWGPTTGNEQRYMLLQIPSSYPIFRPLANSVVLWGHSVEPSPMYGPRSCSPCFWRSPSLRILLRIWRLGDDRRQAYIRSSLSRATIWTRSIKGIMSMFNTSQLYQNGG